MGGFTLAEVLITLGIIGIVAAMTLPVLVGKYREKVLISRAKKTYSIISNALNLAKSKESVSSYEEIFSADATSDESADIIFKNMQVIERCKSLAKGCGNDYTIKPQYRTNDGNGNVSKGGGNTDFSRAVLKDGSIIGIMQTAYSDSGCQNTYIGHQKDENGNYIKDDEGNLIPVEGHEICCAKIYFDTTGKAGPNQYGQDVFLIYVRPSNFLQSNGSINNVLANDKLYFEKYNDAGGKF